MLLIDKVKQVMQDKGLSPSIFADEIGVPRASISHILAGRNKPSIRILMGIIKKFPDIDVNWLLEDDEEQPNRYEKPNLNSKRGPKTNFSFAGTTIKNTNQQINFSKENEKNNLKESEILELAPNTKHTQRTIEKIFIFYTDKTFIEYSPENN